MHARRLLLPTLLLWAAPLLAPPASADTRWRLVEREEGPDPYAMYVSEDEADDERRYKIETRFDATPAQVARTIMALMSTSEFLPDNQRREVLSASDGELVVHTFIDMPMIVSDRDIALRVVHRQDPATGVHRVEWRTTDSFPGGRVPAPASGVVRIPHADGYWEFVPDAAGGCRGTYETYSETGGSIPTWIVKPMMRGQVEGDYQRLLGVLERQEEAVSAAPTGAPLGAPLGAEDG